MDGDCAGCGHRYLQDLPTGHGLVYPATLDLDTGEAIEPGGAVWFAHALRRIWEEPDFGAVHLHVDARRPADNASLLDCLDPVWGHSLLKLLNVQSELAAGRDVIALVPASLRHLVPDGVAEVWSVGESARRFGGWLVELERAIAGELDRLGSCALSPAFPHPHPSTYDLGTLVERFEPERIGKPQVTLCLRDDRLWGADADAEAANLARLCERLMSVHPRAAIAALGVGAATPLPDAVSDLRTAAPDTATEERWISVLRATDVAIGVHGSHLLLPSGLAQVVVELAPRERWGNVLQATLPGRDPILALARQRVLYGADDLADLGAELVADVALAALGERPRIERLMTGAAAGAGEGPIEPIPASPPLPPTGAPERAPRPRPSPLRAARRVAASIRGEEDPATALAARLLERGIQIEDLRGHDAGAPDGAGDIVLLTLSGDRTHEVVDLLERAALATFRLDGEELRPFRPAGPLDDEVTLVAATSGGLGRLHEAGALPH